MERRVAVESCRLAVAQSRISFSHAPPRIALEATADAERSVRVLHRDAGFDVS